MGKKRKYELPHYDRCSPIMRHAIELGASKPMLDRWLKSDERKHGGYAHVPDHYAIAAMLADGGVETLFGDTEWGRHTRQMMQQNYKAHGDKITKAYHKCFDDFLQYNCMDPKVAADPQYKDNAYAEAVSAIEYDRYGRQVFSIMPMMQEMFEHTDLGDLKLDDLHMPFPCFYIAMEDPDSIVDGFYVSKRFDMEGEYLAFIGFKWVREGFHGKGTAGVNKVWLDSYLPTDKAEVLQRDGYLRYHFEIMTKPSEQYSPLHRYGEDAKGTDPNLTLTQIIDKVHGQEHTKGDGVEGFGYGKYGGGEAERPTRPTDQIQGEMPMMEMSRFMVKTAMSLMLYLVSDEKSTVVTSERDEAEAADREIAAGKKARRGRKKRKGREARERRKHLSTARVTRVGGKETDAITSRPGFSFDQPRHWRRGHFHRYWTGPVKIGGVRIPYEEWEDKRTLKRIWTLPALINPDGEIENVTTRTVLSHEDETDQLDELISRMEGMKGEHKQSKIERDPRNRRLCIEAHGAHCHICGDDGEWLAEDRRFNAKGLPSGWLQCHHMEPLGETGPRETDPAKDMIPVCTGCHWIFHSDKPALSLEKAYKVYLRREERKRQIRKKAGN